MTNQELREVGGELMKVGDLVRLTERFSPTEGPDRIAVIVQMIHKDVARICFSDNGQTISVWTKKIVHAD